MMKDFVDHDFSTLVWDYDYKTNSKNYDPKYNARVWACLFLWRACERILISLERWLLWFENSWFLSSKPSSIYIYEWETCYHLKKADVVL